MKTKLTPYYITLVYDACLKSFWRKQALGMGPWIEVEYGLNLSDIDAYRAFSEARIPTCGSRPPRNARGSPAC